MKTFKTHKGEVVSGAKLKKAINEVCDDCIARSHAIRKDDAYASHITTEEKNKILADNVSRFEGIRSQALSGELRYLPWFLRDLDCKLTGESLPILP